MAAKGGAASKVMPPEEARVAQEAARRADLVLPAAPPPPPANAPPEPRAYDAAKTVGVEAGLPAPGRMAPVVQREALSTGELAVSNARQRRAGLSAFVPGATVGWRYMQPGLVLRTVDGGTQWTQQSLPGGARLMALSAVSSSLCWAAGAAGVILRTTDGSTWQSVASPTTSDITSIAALDDHRATIGTSDGVTYDTGDGGATWRRR
jgi:hypothetical protein